jgi:UDP-N-acetylmuramate--alanine ligase
MYQEFADVLESHADHTVVLDVYGAREDPVPGVTGELVSNAFTDPSHVHFVADWQAAADYTATVARDGDYVITLGCGNVNLIIPQVLDALAHTSSPGAGE